MPEKIDKKCYKLFKRIANDSSNGMSTSTIDYEPTPTAYNNNLSNVPGHRHKSSTRQHPKTHSSKIETSKSRSTSANTSSKRNRLQQQPHHVRHHHNEAPLRNYHTISNKENKNIDSNDNLSSTKQLGNEDINSIYNHNDSGVNIASESKGKQHNRHTKKPTQSVVKSPKLEPDHQSRGLSTQKKHQAEAHQTNDNVGRDENNNDTNNCTYSAKITEDETDDKLLRGSRKIAKGRNAAHANDKPNNKCNNNNRRNRKNSRRQSQKLSAHKQQQTSP